MWFSFPLFIMENKWLVCFFLFNSQLFSSSIPSSTLKDFSNFALSCQCSKISVIQYSGLAETSIAPSQAVTVCLAQSCIEPHGQDWGPRGKGRNILCMCSNLIELSWEKYHSNERIKPHSEIHLSGWIIFCPSPQEIWHFSLCHPLCLKTLNGPLLSKG